MGEGRRNVGGCGSHPDHGLVGFAGFDEVVGEKDAGGVGEFAEVFLVPGVVIARFAARAAWWKRILDSLSTENHQSENALNTWKSHPASRHRRRDPNRCFSCLRTDLPACWKS